MRIKIRKQLNYWFTTVILNSCHCNLDNEIKEESVTKKIRPMCEYSAIYLSLLLKLMIWKYQKQAVIAHIKRRSKTENQSSKYESVENDARQFMTDLSFWTASRFRSFLNSFHSMCIWKLASLSDVFVSYLCVTPCKFRRFWYPPVFNVFKFISRVFFLRKIPKNYNLVNFVQPVKRHMFATLPKCYDLINEFDRASVLAFWCIFFSFVKRLTNLMIIMVRCLKSVQMEPKDIIWIEFCVFFSPNFQRKKKYLFINDITTILGGNRRCFQLWL